MYDFLTEHYGNLFSIIGVVVSAAGLAWAVIEARRARSAARSAERATIETRDNIGRHLLAIDLERAVSLIQRLKLLHSAGLWEAALEQYQVLRAMISVIDARYPGENPERRERLFEARAIIRQMENHVGSQVHEELGADYQAVLNSQLNDIQSDLEDMSSAMGFSD